MQIPLLPGQVGRGERHEYQVEQRRPEGKKNRSAADVQAFTQPQKALGSSEKRVGKQPGRASAVEDPSTKSLKQLSEGISALLAGLSRLVAAVAAYIGSPLAFPSSSPVARDPVKPDKSDGKAAVSEKPVSEKTAAVDPKPAQSTGKRPGTADEACNIWDGFKQGPDGNCVTVSAIKAAMMRFGQKPADIYKEVKAAGDGYNVVMRDGFGLHFSKEEFRQAARAAQFQGNDPSLVNEANFLFAASAKRAQMKDNDGYAGNGFAEALQSLNDGEGAREGLERLGLRHRIRETNAWELARGQLGVVAHGINTAAGVIGHSLAVIEGKEEVWGKKGSAPPADAHAIALD
ncbi:hypothetical protein [Pseudomonas graminis]